MKKSFKYLVFPAVAILGALALVGCSSGSDKNSSSSSSSKSTSSESSSSSTSKDSEKILVAAAASLEYAFKDELIPMFEKENPTIKVEGTYDSSGKLQTQIEEGLEADLFFSAATKQMDALVDESLIEKSSVVDLLENEIVLITQKDSTTTIASFDDIKNAETIALGDPDSVPVGQYSKEALENLGEWDEIQSKVSYGSNVTEVLNWVAAGSAEVGIVYATDAATIPDQVKVIAKAPQGSLATKIIYPIGLLEKSEHKDAAKLFEEFLQSDEAIKVFEDYGFKSNLN